MNNIETNLKKEGINVIKSLDTLTINTIAKNVSQILCATFPEQNLNYNETFIKISRLNMYVANMPKDMSVAKYYYKNSSIYLSNKMDFKILNKCLIHECIHALQTKRDLKNDVIKLGLCNFSNSRLPGMALNEAVVQLMSEECIKSVEDSVKYYGIELSTISPDYYPLECAIANQMAYITGKQCMYHSTIFSDSIFKDTFISFTSKKCFYTVEKNLDIMMNLEDKIVYLTNKLNSENMTNKLAFKISKQILQMKNIIMNLFINTQNIIIKTYFDSFYKEISTYKDIENLRNKLYGYKNYIGTTENYTFYNDYYKNMMQLLENKYDELDGITTLPTIYNESKLLIAFKKLKQLFSKQQSTMYGNNLINK